MRKSALFFFCIFLGLSFTGLSQNQSIADSLILVLDAKLESDTSRLQLLTFIAQNHNDPDQRIRYSRQLAVAAEKEENKKYLHHAYLQMGQAYRMKGDFEPALNSLFKAREFAEQADYSRGIAGSNTALGDAYSILGRYDEAILYYQKSIQKVGDGDNSLLAVTLLNLGDTYYSIENYDSALYCFETSKSIYEALGNDPSGLAYNLGNLGLVQAEKGNNELAVQKLREAIISLEKLGDHYGSAIFLGFMADIYKRKEMLKEAKTLADSSLAISLKYGLKTEQRDNLLRLSTIFQEQQNFRQAHHYYQQYVAVKDSISSQEVLSKIENLETKVELAKKEAEVELLTAQQKNQQAVIVTATAIVFAFAILVIVIFTYYRSKIRINRILERQKVSLESLNETKDKFFSIISHDLRGPVSSLMGVSHLIRHFVESKDEDQLLEMANYMETSVDQISALLDNLLSWAMQQQGHFPNVPEKVDFNSMIVEIIGMFSNMAAGKKINLESHIEVPLQLWVDRNSVHTIFRNLINNSIKFTKEGGLVAITAHEENGMAMILVEDTGIGMPQDKLKKLFRLNEEKSTYGTAGEKGLGLGLQLVYEFVQMNNGEIKAKSAEHAGTTFTISLPLFGKKAGK